MIVERCSVNYIYPALRVLIALVFAGIGFVFGLYLPLCIHWLLHGDPGMPGGAGLALIGLPIGVAAGIVVALFCFFKLPLWKQDSK
jgi:hypothetical protein